MVRCFAVSVLGLLVWCRVAAAQDESEIEARVVEIFQQTCTQAGCHAGSDPQMGMSLEPEHFFAHVVEEPSRERPDLMLVDPGNPEESYLVRKVRGEPDIVGAQMPLTGRKLSDEEISTIESWVNELADTDVEARKAGQQVARRITPFSGWRIVNLPTTRMVDGGKWLFLIGHRFLPAVDTGFDAFYGVDGPAVIFLNLGYAPTDDLLINLGRSNAAGDVELQLKYRIAQQAFASGWPVSLAAMAAMNWITEEFGDEGRFRSQALKYTLQLVADREIFPGISLGVVPGVLFNPDDRASGDEPLLTVGLGARWEFRRRFSIVGEWVPIVSGYTLTRTAGNENRFDSFGGGLEIAIGGHIFQIVLTNSAGIASDQYLRGGDLDIEKPDFRLGFNIFRILNF